MRYLPHAALVLGLCCLAAPAAAEDAIGTNVESVQAAEPATGPVHSSGWEFSSGPYLWMSGLKGDMGVSEEVEPVAVDLSFIDIINHMKFVVMTTFDTRHDRFVATGDLLFLKLAASDNIEIREIDFADVKLKTSTFIMTTEAGYRVVDQGRLFVDLLAGGRLNSMKVSLDLEGPRRSFSGSKTETWLDPVVGVRFQAPLGQHWALKTYGDIGGFGVGSHFTWQVSGVVEYELSRRWSTSAGWRHLSIDYDQKGFVFDAAMDGPILGAVYRF